MACLYVVPTAWPTHSTYHGLQLLAFRCSDQACFANLVHHVWLASKLRLRKGRQLFFAAHCCPHKYPAAGQKMLHRVQCFRSVAWQGPWFGIQVAGPALGTFRGDYEQHFATVKLSYK